jgi:hypothetical protein
VFRRKRKPPSKQFTHDEGCRIVAVDPGVEIPWSYLGDGRWKAECACGVEYFNESAVDDRVRLDPLDPKTSRHLGQCDYVSETDPAVLKVLLKVKPGMGEGYDWGSAAAAAPASRLRTTARASVDGASTTRDVGGQSG